jgi:hypothetical protein
MGVRRLSQLAGFHKDTVCSAIEELSSAGHITVIGNGKLRRIYNLNSRLFGQKQRAGVEEVIGSPSGGRRFASKRSA